MAYNYSYTSSGVAFANLGQACGGGSKTPAPPNCAPQIPGSLIWCKDCTNTTTCGGGGSGAWAILNAGSTWGCNVNGVNQAAVSGVLTNLTAGPGAISITGNSGNGTDTMKKVCVDGKCPVTIWATCNGTGSDNTGFGNAVAYAITNNVELDIPPGSTCMLANEQIGASGTGTLRLHGAGIGQSVIREIPSSAADSFLLSSPQTSNVQYIVDGVDFDCNQANEPAPTVAFDVCVAFSTTKGAIVHDSAIRNYNGWEALFLAGNLNPLAEVYNNVATGMVASAHNNAQSGGPLIFNLNATQDIAINNNCVDPAGAQKGKCVFVDEYPFLGGAGVGYVTIVGNQAKTSTGYAVGNTDSTAAHAVPVYGVVDGNTEDGCNAADGGIIVGGDAFFGSTFVSVANNVINGCTGTNTTGIQVNNASWVTETNNALNAASNSGTFAYYINSGKFVNIIAGATQGFGNIIGTANGAGLANIASLDTFITGPNFGNGGIADSLNMLTGTETAYGPVSPAGVSLALTGTATAGAATCFQEIAGSVKTTTCYLNAYQETGSAQTATYPVTFSTFPTVLEGGNGANSCGTYNPTSTASTLTLPANAAMTAETCTITVIGQ